MKWLFFSIYLNIISAETQPLKTSGLKSEYLLNEPVTVVVTNISSSNITYGIGVLRKENGKWEELFTNIEDREFGRKAFKLRSLAENQSAQSTWFPKRSGKPYIVEKGLYRFYVAFSSNEGDKKTFNLEISEDIGSEVDKYRRQLLYSEPFELR